MQRTNLLKLFYKSSNDKFKKILNINSLIIKKLARIETLEKIVKSPDKSLTFTLDSYEFYLNISQNLDILSELKRLKKMIDKNESELISLNKKIKNINFLEKAPKILISDTKERIDELEIGIKKLHIAFERIKKLT